LPPIMYNNNALKKSFMVKISEALDAVLEEGFGKIEVIYDKERGVQDVIPSPRIRVKS